jgi:hypothetical protein
MKKIIWFYLLFGLAACKQGVSGMAVYESKPAQLILNQFRRKQEVTPEMQKSIEERMKGMFEKPLF